MACGCAAGQCNQSYSNAATGECNLQANAIQKQHEDNASQRGPKMVEVSGEMAIAALQKLDRPVSDFGFTEK